MCFGLVPFIFSLAEGEDTTGHKMVYLHNISPKGLGLIHIGQLNPGMLCACWPRDTAKRPECTLPGAVRWCRQLTGHIYMSGIELDCTIDVGQYLL